MGLAATTTRQYSKNTQTTQLLLTHWREMSRNASNFYFTMLFPFIYVWHVFRNGEDS